MKLSVRHTLLLIIFVIALVVIVAVLHPGDTRTAIAGLTGFLFGALFMARRFQ